LSISKKELTILKTIIEKHHTTATTLAEATHTPPQSISRYITQLEEKGFITTKKEGVTKTITIAETPHALLIRKQILENEHMNLEPITNTGMKILLTINCLNLTSWEEVMKYAGVSYRALRPKMNQFTSMGLVIKEKNYEINPRLQIIKEFLQKYNEYIQAKEIKKIAEDATIKWCCGDTSIFETENKLTLPTTGISAFQEYGAIFYTIKNLYIKTKQRNLKLEDHIINHIHSEKTSNILPLLITWKLNEKNIDTKYLQKQAYLQKIPEIINSIIKYLDSEGKTRTDYQPPWNEFIAKYRDYSNE